MALASNRDCPAPREHALSIVAGRVHPKLRLRWIPVAFGAEISRGSMTILVTGGGGYIGSHMAHALVDAGEPVVVVDNLTTRFRSALPESATLVVGDIGDQALLTSVIKTHAVTEIIHFAASIVVPDS